MNHVLHSFFIYFAVLLVTAFIYLNFNFEVVVFQICYEILLKSVLAFF